MSWEGISAIAEIVGATGVILSLIYLALQIKHGARASEDASTKEVFASFVAQMSAMAAEGNREVFAKGLMDYEKLAGHEKIAFDSLMAGLFAVVESSFISNSANLMTDELMRHWSGYLKPRLFAYPGMRDWWSESKSVYVPSVQAWIESEIDETEMDTDFWKMKPPSNKAIESDA
jgi:hypothetical protein